MNCLKDFSILLLGVQNKLKVIDKINLKKSTRINLKARRVIICYYPAFQIVNERYNVSSGIEPLFYKKSQIFISFCGEYRDRTGDLLVANQTLSQLS